MKAARQEWSLSEPSRPWHHIFLPSVLRAFRETHPAVALDLSEGTTQEVARLVLAGDLAFAVVSTLEEPLSGLTLEELFSEPMLVALPAWHALAARPEIHSGDLASEPLLLLKEGHCLKKSGVENLPSARFRSSWRRALRSTQHLAGF